MVDLQAIRPARNILPWHINNIITILNISLHKPANPDIWAFRRFSLIFCFALNPSNSPQIYADSRANGAVSNEINRYIINLIFSTLVYTLQLDLSIANTDISVPFKVTSEVTLKMSL